MHKTLSYIPKNSSIKVCKIDKGNGVIIMDKLVLDYFKKLDKIILDKTCFDEINYNINTKSTKNCKLA